MSKSNLTRSILPSERLLSLWRAAHHTEGVPTEAELLAWSARVVVASMGYYIAELDDPELDPDCPVCCAMIGLGKVLGGLVAPPAGIPYRNWKERLARRLNRLGLKMPPKISEKWDHNERQAAG